MTRYYKKNLRVKVTLASGKHWSKRENESDIGKTFWNAQEKDQGILSYCDESSN